MKTLLLTPGPLTTADETRAAMGRDWGSRDGDFIAMSERVRARLAAIPGLAESHVAIPLQGSGTFAVEAAIQSLMPRQGKLLVLVNGAYGRRAVAIAERLGRAVASLEWAEDEPVEPAGVAGALARDPAITDVFAIHCETTSGILNPLEEIAAVVEAAGRRLLVDAMSSFATLPIDGAKTPCSALIASSNKGLEGAPGIGFVIAERRHLAACAENASSTSLDLYAQWQGFERNQQWRFTPPVQVVAALDTALDRLEAEGGVTARHARYSRNRDLLLDGMKALGFEPYLAPALQAPVIVTFKPPRAAWYDFECFYAALHRQGVVIYPGKLTREDSFRIGCIGAIDETDMRHALDVIADHVTAARG